MVFAIMITKKTKKQQQKKNNKQPYSEPPEKDLEKPSHPHRKLPPFGPPSPQNCRRPPWGGYGYFLELHNSCIIHVENIGDEMLNLDLISIGG